MVGLYVNYNFIFSITVTEQMEENSDDDTTSIVIRAKEEQGVQ